MHSVYFITTFLALTWAAPSPHFVAHQRRERFLRRHAQAVHEALGHPSEPSTNNPSTHLEAEHLPSVNVSAPNIAIHRAPTHTTNLNATYNVDYSGNWCGAVHTAPAVPSATYTAVSATWSMPNLTAPGGSSVSDANDGPETFYGSTWVGIDGYTYTGAILQAGTTSAVTIYPNGTEINTASAWFEWFPNPETPIPDFTVNPGDTISCTVQSTSDTAGTVVIRNDNTGQLASQDFTAPNATASLRGVNAEWIYEDFSAGGLVPFASFTPTTLTNCTAEMSDGTVVGLNDGTTLVDLVIDNEIVCTAQIADDEGLLLTYGGAGTLPA